ncbi:MAG: IS110 family transposase [Deltaproteobacteria bacterium]|nr:IS110 family transposase [Deltaproteobacteria bacterium]
MEVIHPRCAGLDVHKETVMACVRLAAGNKVTRQIKTFATTTSELLSLLAWLREQGCSHVAMEATGVYWKPVWNILSDGDFELVLANAAHIKNVPGRKTDVSDAAWIADLQAHGLIRSSFVPEQEVQELRELLRTRKQLTRQQTSHVQRLQKTLESANIKLDSVITDIVGKTGRAMISALIAGESNPLKLAVLADRRIQASHQELREALHGRVTDHHRFLLHVHLQHIDFADAAMRDIDARIEALIKHMDQEVKAGHAPFHQLITLLMTIPGVSLLSARTILAEIGPDMSRFPTAAHLLSWAGLCPANNESAGKRRSTRLRKGNLWLKTLLVQCACAAKRKKNSYFNAQFYRLCHRRGPKKATCAVAASILTTVYHILKDGTQFRDLGPDHLDGRSKELKVKRLVTQLARLGFDAKLVELASPS